MVCESIKKTLDASNLKYLSLKVRNIIFIPDNLKSSMNVAIITRYIIFTVTIVTTYYATKIIDCQVNLST